MQVQREPHSILWRRVPSALAQPRPLQAVDRMLVLDGACLSDVARAERLEGVVAEELASHIILDVVDSERAWPRGLFLR